MTKQIESYSLQSGYHSFTVDEWDDQEADNYGLLGVPDGQWGEAVKIDNRLTWGSRYRVHRYIVHGQ